MKIAEYPTVLPGHKIPGYNENITSNQFITNMPANSNSWVISQIGVV